jgi:integrase
MTDFDEKLASINQTFREVDLGLQIEQRGRQLVLRGTLPPKPGSKRLQAHQQRISLGLPANLEGLSQATQQAKLIASQTIQASFSWQGYDAGDVPIARNENKSDTWSDRIAIFEQHFWATRSKNASTRSTWETAYKPYLARLVEVAQAKPRLSAAEQVYQAVLDTDARSRSRQVCCTALKALCEFMDLAVPFDWQKLWGSYNQQSLQARDLPDDENIVNWYYQITHPGWQFVYGVMATYGLRNHEVFFCDYSDLKAGGQTITVLESTKTGSHEVWPFAPEWIDIFQLREQNTLPAVNTDLASTTLQRIGQRVTRQFKRYNLPFSPYDLRHAWAVRTIHYGLPDAIAAQMMGHSLSIHTRTYQRWITHRDRAQAVDDALQRRKLQER